MAAASSRLFVILIDNFIPGDVLFDGLVLREKELRPAAAAVFDLVVDDRLTIGTLFQGHMIIPLVFRGLFERRAGPEL
jgi:hypothetical protein